MCTEIQREAVRDTRERDKEGQRGRVSYLLQAHAARAVVVLSREPVREKGICLQAGIAVVLI